jgi:hypothetical protein
VETGLGLLLPSLLPEVGPPAALEALVATFEMPKIEALPTVDLSIGFVAPCPSDVDADSMSEAPGSLSIQPSQRKRSSVGAHS